MKEELLERAAKMGLSLTETQADQFVRYFELLVEWNEKMNLTAIVDEEGVLSKHFLDSISAAPFLMQQFGESFSLIDVGTGAGFPGIPLKILFPQMKLVLLDSLQKRVTFLETVCRELGFTDCACIHGRAEELAHRHEYREIFDVACARAVSALPALAEYCGGYVRKGGIFLAYKGPGWQEEYEGHEKLFATLRLKLKQSVPVEIPETDLAHELVVFTKTGEWLLHYPRSQSKIKGKQ